MVKKLKDMGVETMVSIWPQVDKLSENYEEMVEKGLLVQTERGMRLAMDFQGETIHIDATNPEARQYIWDKAKKNYYNKGVSIERYGSVLGRLANTALDQGLLARRSRAGIQHLRLRQLPVLQGP